MRRLALIAAATVAVAVTPACSHDPAALKVGAVYPRTGAQGVQGSEEFRGVALAAQWANDHHALGAKTIKLVPVDAPRAEAVDRVMAGLQAQGVNLVVGSHGSAVSAAAADSATARHMLFWETGAVGQIAPTVQGGRSFFRLAPMGANLGRNAIDFMAAELTPKEAPGRSQTLRYGVAHVDDAYGRAVAAGASTEIGARHLTLAAEFSYPATGADYDAIARQIAAAHIDVLFVAAYLDDGVALREAMVRDHVHLVASIGTSSSYCHLAFGQRLGPDAVGLFASDKPDAANVRADALTAEARSALAWASHQYKAAYHDDMSAPALSGFSNAVALFDHVLPAARTTRPDDVADAAVRVKLAEGSLANGGGMDIAPPTDPDGGENRAASGVIWEWVAPAKRAVVWPPAFAEHAIVPLPIA